MKASLTSLLLAGALLALPGLLPAQHYVAGVEGIKGASIPPPGFYVRDYNVFYTAGRMNDGDGDKVPMDFNAFVYANVIRGIWVADGKVLGGNFVMDALIPLQYTDIKAGGFKDDNFGIGDIYVEPAALAWHGKQWDAALGYSFWAPTGEFDAMNPTKPGLGFWGHMLTFGGTYYFDTNKTWAVSLLNRYEFNMEQEDTDVTPGQTWTLEWGLSKSLKPTIDVGVVGYYQLQTTDNSGAAGGNRPQRAGVGPEIVMLCPKLMLFTSLRYNYEFFAENRPQGHTIALTFTKRF